MEEVPILLALKLQARRSSDPPPPFLSPSPKNPTFSPHITAPPPARRQVRDTAHVAGVAFLNPLSRELGACEITDDAQLTALEGVRAPTRTHVHPRAPTRTHVHPRAPWGLRAVRCLRRVWPRRRVSPPAAQVLVQLGARECIVSREAAAASTPAGRRLRDVLSRCGVLANEQKARARRRSRAAAAAALGVVFSGFCALAPRHELTTPLSRRGSAGG